jgi:uncharacterized protein
MEIRFETALLDRTFSPLKEHQNSRGGDCRDCQSTSIVEILRSDHISDIHTCTIQHTPGLYKQACGNGYYVVCNPTGRGLIAVLDEEAADLLEYFRFPTTFSHLRIEEEFPGQASLAVSLFHKLGFLQNAAQSTAISMQEKTQTLSAWLHVTNACNLRCDYCYVDKTPEPMTDDTAKRAVDAIFRSAVKHNFNMVWLRYAGGEASLQSERVIALHDYALTLAQKHDIKLYASILSNGVFLGQRTIDRLKARNIGVMISLDGIGAYHDRQRPFVNGRGSFRFVDRTITQLLAKKLIPNISVTVSLRNLTGLPELVAYILERDMPFSLNYYRDNDCSTHIHDLRFNDEQMIAAMRSVFALIEHNLPQRSLLDALIDKADLQQPHYRTCGVGHNYLVIDQKGGVAKCHADIKRTITTIATDDPLLVIRNDRQGVQGHTVHEKEGCRSCSWRNWCTGGCPLLTFRATGRSDVKSPNCNIYKALFPDVLRLEALRLLKYVPPLLERQSVEDRGSTSLFYV